MITTEMFRKLSAEIPVALTIAVRKSVKKVKLKIKPITMPIGRFLLPVKEPERMIGRIGRMQGERIVTMPARRAKRIKMIISFMVE